MRTDTERLDFLQTHLSYSDKVVCRVSNTGRGWRLHETTATDGVNDIRQAIDIYIDKIKEIHGSSAGGGGATP